MHILFCRCCSQFTTAKVFVGHPVGCLLRWLSNDGKWVFNMACTMPWCHTVVHFEVKMNYF